MAIRAGWCIALARGRRFAVDAGSNVLCFLLMTGAARFRLPCKVKQRSGCGGWENVVRTVTILASRRARFPGCQCGAVCVCTITSVLRLMAGGARHGRKDFVIVRVLRGYVVVATETSVCRMD